MNQFQKTKILAVILILAFSCMLSACESLKKSEVKQDVNVLRVGVTPDSPPLIYKQGEEIIGLEADLAMALAKYLGKQAVFVDLRWGDQIPALQEKKIDIIMSGMSITKAREYDISFAMPYFRTGQMALFGDSGILSLQKSYHTLLAQVPGLRIGVIRGTTGETFVKRYFRRARDIISYTNPENAMTAMKWKKIDVFIYDMPTILMLTAKHQADGFKPMLSLLTEEYFAWGIRKNDPDLLAAANKFLVEFEEKGDLDTIVKKWIPLPE